jgi:hypothetical protein
MGWVLYLDFALLFFPVCQGSFLNRLTGTAWSRIVKYHR